MKATRTYSPKSESVNTSRRAFTVGAAAVLAAVPACVVTATPADPLVELWARYAVARAKANAAAAAWEPLQDQLMERDLLYPRVLIGTFQASDRPPVPMFASALYEIDDECDRMAAAGMAPAAVERRRVMLVAELAESKARCDKAAADLGLPALWAASSAADDEADEIGSAIRKTPATTVAGLLAKLRYLSEWVGNAEQRAAPDDEADLEIFALRRIIADAERLAAQGGAA